MRLLKAADALRKKGGDSHIAVDHIVLAALGDSQLSKLLTEGAGLGACMMHFTTQLPSSLVTAGLNLTALTEAITQLRGTKRVTSESAEATYDAL